MVGIVLGPGLVWQYRNTGVAERAELASRAATEANLREKLNSILLNIVGKSERYSRIRDSVDWTTNSDAYNELVRLRQQIALLKDDFTAIERGLAAVESREPRSIELDAIAPPPVRDLKVRVHPTARGDSVWVVGEWKPPREGP